MFAFEEKEKAGTLFFCRFLFSSSGAFGISTTTEAAPQTAMPCLHAVSSADRNLAESLPGLLLTAALAIWAQATGGNSRSAKTEVQGCNLCWGGSRSFQLGKWSPPTSRKEELPVFILKMDGALWGTPGSLLKSDFQLTAAPVRICKTCLSKALSQHHFPTGGNLDNFFSPSKHNITAAFFMLPEETTGDFDS